MNIVNISIESGNLVRDPELRYIANGSPVCNFTIASSDKATDKNPEPRTAFIDVVLWGSRGEVVANMKKGDPILVIGKQITETWEDQNGNKRSKQKIQASFVADPIFAKSDNRTSGGSHLSPSASSGSRVPTGMNGYHQPEDIFPIEDDDIPF